jgi:hypothetical protein
MVAKVTFANERETVRPRRISRTTAFGSASRDRVAERTWTNRAERILRAWESAR